MTIITKPITEKKAEKLVLPPTENDQLATGDAVSLTTFHF